MSWPKGRKHTPGERAAISAAMQRPDARAKLSAAMTGRSPSGETRAKISASMTGHQNALGNRSGLRHGHSTRGATSSTYNCWANMLQRCYNPNRPDYKYYGMRGITVCAQWSPSEGGSFDTFLRDMGEKPEGLTLERTDNDGPYYPWNCRWATREEQSNNPTVGKQVHKYAQSR